MNTKFSRPAAVAGQFYPADPQELRDLVKLLIEPTKPHIETQPGDVLLVPHAGYQYSGHIAGRAYATLRNAASSIKRVLILGPAHRKALNGAAVSSADKFSTPLGDIPVAQDDLKRLVDSKLAIIDDDAHALEHAIEVQLPFLQLVCRDFSILPVAVGNADASLVESIVALFWRAPDALTIVSTDLSHFNDVEAASIIDQQTIETILNGPSTAIDSERACGSRIVNGLLPLMRHHGAISKLVDFGNSADTGGPTNRVVGYASVSFNAT